MNITEPNKHSLKLAMARLLPEMVEILGNESHSEIYGAPTFIWKEGELRGKQIELDGWLYVMHLVEQKEIKNSTDEQNYYHAIERNPFATFNQRATAMCEVKGIEIV